MQEEEVTEVTAPAGKDIISLNQITYHIFKSLRDNKKQVGLSKERGLTSSKEEGLPVPGGQRNIFFGQNVSRIVTRQQEAGGIAFHILKRGGPPRPRRPW